MAFRRIAQLFTLFFALLFVAISSFSQSTTGTPLNDTFDGEVNVGTLDVHLNIPIYDRGNFHYALTYDSNIWKVNKNGNWTPDAFRMERSRQCHT